MSLTGQTAELPCRYSLSLRLTELDKETLSRLNDIAKLPEENKRFVFNMLDMALRDFKAKQAYAK